MRAENRSRCFLGCRKPYRIRNLFLVFAIGFYSIGVQAIRDKFDGISSNGSSFEGISSNGSSVAVSKEDSFAEIIDRALEKEFSDKDQPEGPDVSSFNNSVTEQQAVLETVARVTRDKPKKNETLETNGTSRSFQIQDVLIWITRMEWKIHRL